MCLQVFHSVLDSLINYDSSQAHTMLLLFSIR
jgi:hypothetical protein